MIDLIVLFLVFTILAIVLAGMWIFATTVKMDVKYSDGNYLVKK